MSNWDFTSPEGRLAALTALGSDEYNRQLRQHHHEQVTETVNGYDIRKIPTKFGILFQIGTTSSAFSDLEDAKTYAKQLPARG